MKRCPHCSQPMPDVQKLVRSCFDCGQPIRRHAKWTWQIRHGVLTAVHRHCDNPEGYEPADAPITPKTPLFAAGDEA